MVASNCTSIDCGTAPRRMVGHVTRRLRPGRLNAASPSDENFHLSVLKVTEGAVLSVWIATLADVPIGFFPALPSSILSTCLPSVGVGHSITMRAGWKSVGFGSTGYHPLESAVMVTGGPTGIG